MTVTYTFDWDLRFGSVRQIGSTTFHLQLNQHPDGGAETREFMCIGSGISEGNQHEGRSALPILINQPPRSGTCASSVPIPVLEFLQPTPQQVQINCQGFGDPNLPLTYEVTAMIPKDDDDILPAGVLLYHTVFEELPLLYFPMGEDQGGAIPNHQVKLQIQVSDAFGFPAEVSTL